MHWLLAENLTRLQIQLLDLFQRGLRCVKPISDTTSAPLFNRLLSQPRQHILPTPTPIATP